MAAALHLGLALPSGVAVAQPGANVSVADQRFNPSAPAAAPAHWRPLQDYSRVPIPLHIRAPELTEAERQGAAAKPRGPAIIGIGRPAPAGGGALSRSLAWSQAGVGQVAAFRVTSPGAKAMRIALKGELPEGGLVRFFSLSDADERFRPFVRQDFHDRGWTRRLEKAHGQAATARRLVWSPTVAGESIGVEVSLPSAAAQADLSLQVVRIAHLLRHAAASGGAAPQPSDDASSCSGVDVSCSDASGCDRMATVRISFTEDQGATYVCTATTLNDQRDAQAKAQSTHLLTASHCINSQEAADTLEAWWRYQTASCGSNETDSRFASLGGGADLVATHAASDHSLLKLRGPLPSLPVCWKGWSGTVPSIGEPVGLAHHPQGGLKEWAEGEAIGELTLAFAGEHPQFVDAILVEYGKGATAPGSSGAALLAADSGHILGVLSGGPEDQCAVDGFGRFDRFLPLVQSVLAGEAPSDGGVLDDHDDALAGATGIALPHSETSGHLDFAGDVDFFRIEVAQGGTLSLWTTGGTDTVGALLLENGETAAQNDDSGQGRNFRISYEVTPGIYYVRVAGHEDAIGAYLLLVSLQSTEQATYEVPLFLADVPGAEREGFMRIINDSLTSGTVEITAIDDAGDEFGPVRLSLQGGAGRHINSSDLERGNQAKGLPKGVGDGVGDWRLELTTTLDIRPMAYVRTKTGFVGGMEALVAGDARAYEVLFFNPASNQSQRSLLRLINPNFSEQQITIIGRDDRGQAGAGPVRLNLAGKAAITLNARQLEQGDADVGLRGQLGDGEGKWRLTVSSRIGIKVMNLLESPTGSLSNLSAVHIQKNDD